eukprot:CAMPEP_0119096358 /NCGR_PEP_ID=MMETSP1178-20130426/172614_1 /TAXON_ID=33656 /ORGANISM="unid sp, Strain CCMP2000" /LENGTH=74 /DNA_ID=CAMNT_0007080237 /DNA_START=50 /DNA_END=270 /DNA_ORIENTATION=-
MSHGTICCICLEDAPRRITCTANHVTCEDCLGQYIITKADDLAKTDLLAAKAETSEITKNVGQLAELAGGCFCP